MQRIPSSLTLTAVLLGGIAAGAQAAPMCNALAAPDACTANSSCRWVAGYQRKDGIAVKAHCRARPAPKATAAVTASGKVADDTAATAR